MNERPNRPITVMELVMKPIVVFLLGISLNFVLGEVEASDSIRNSEKEESETRRVVRKEAYEVRLKRLTQELTIHLQEVINARKGEGRLDELASFSWTRVCPVTAYGVWVEKIVPEIDFKSQDLIPWLMDEGKWTLLFINENELLPIKIDRKFVNHPQWTSPPPCLSGRDTRFRITYPEVVITLFAR